MSELTVQGKRVLVRQDLNVPLRDGQVASTARIDAALPTIEALLGQGARVAVMSHSGRPKEGMREPEFSLAPVAKIMSRKLGRHVPLITDWIDGFEQTDDLVLLENVRYLRGEKQNNEALARKMASLCDIYLMDAFGTAHRAHASTCVACMRHAEQAHAPPQAHCPRRPAPSCGCGAASAARTRRSHPGP